MEQKPVMTFDTNVLYILGVKARRQSLLQSTQATRFAKMTHGNENCNKDPPIMRQTNRLGQFGHPRVWRRQARSRAL